MSDILDTATSIARDLSVAGWTERYSNAVMDTFGPPQRVLVRGEGAYVWDADGKRYLDLLAGIAVNSLGHAHPTLTAAISAQLGTLGHGLRAEGGVECQAVPEREVLDVARERFERLPVRDLVRERQSAHRAAVERAVEREDARARAAVAVGFALGSVEHPPRHLESGLDRLGARVGEEGA